MDGFNDGLLVILVLFKSLISLKSPTKRLEETQSILCEKWKKILQNLILGFKYDVHGPRKAAFRKGNNFHDPWFVYRIILKICLFLLHSIQVTCITFDKKKNVNKLSVDYDVFAIKSHSTFEILPFEIWVITVISRPYTHTWSIDYSAQRLTLVDEWIWSMTRYTFNDYMITDYTHKRPISDRFRHL